MMSTSVLYLVDRSDLAASAQISQHYIDANFIDGTQCSVGYAQTYPAVFAFYPELAILQVRQETTFSLVVGVGNVVPGHRTLAGDFANTRHG
ncbi:hypothetical protein BI347_06425 [Chromobacterium sphagni]|uniref:Uncharacterized protein n=1 Tax=Chromobacterium sphagni TaxID=1903179 RepID=A0A1S1X1H6_9NEIS|nr:hypothetical protein BI347_06425 [Chromobacterium sphagni]